MKSPTLLACSQAVLRAHDAAPMRTEANTLQRQLLLAAVKALGSLGTLTTEQLNWLTMPEAQAAVKAAYKAARENL